MNGLEVRIPVRGEVLLRFEGSEETHKVGSFEQAVPVRFDPGAGMITVSFDTMPAPVKEEAEPEEKGEEPETGYWSVVDLRRFISDRLEEDEEIANAALAPNSMHPYGDKELPAIAPEKWGEQVDGYLGGTWGTHAAHWNPLRALAEVQMKRVYLQYSPVKTLKAMASVYADHKDYRPHWALSEED